MVIEAHNHFWQYDKAKQSWVNDDMAVLKKDFLSKDLYPLMQQNKIDGCIAVQASESEKENDFLLQLAAENNFVKGIVGWIDMFGNDVEQRLQYYSQFKMMKGFRYVLQDKTDRALILEPVFKKNIAFFKQYRFTYDIIILNDQLGFADTLVKSFPLQKFMLNHLAKPAIKLNEITEWRAAITTIAKNENLHCKLSGMVTKADWATHTYHDFLPYMELILEVFGSKRILFGSDCPVCLLAASYKNGLDMVKQFVATLSANEQENIMGNNAITFYSL